MSACASVGSGVEVAGPIGRCRAARIDIVSIVRGECSEAQAVCLMLIGGPGPAVCAAAAAVKHTRFVFITLRGGPESVRVVCFTAAAAADMRQGLFL